MVIGTSLSFWTKCPRASLAFHFMSIFLTDQTIAVLSMIYGHKAMIDEQTVA